MDMRPYALLAFSLWAVPTFAQTPGFNLQGRITVDKPSTSIRIVLEDPKQRNTEVASAVTDEAGNYEIRNLTNRSYRVIAYVDGKKQDRRELEILCRPGSIATKDYHYGKSQSTLLLHFPSEDPDIVDVAELQGNYSRDLLRDYEKAYQDYINDNAARAIERLEAIALRAPDFYGAHARLGLLYQQEGCFFDAEAEYTRASQLSPRSPQPLLNLASVQIRAADAPGELEKMVTRALESLMKAMEIRPGSAIAHCLAGAARIKTDSFEQAEQDFKRALELDATLAAARLMLANLYFHQERWEAGIENLQTYLEDFPFARDRSVVREMLQNAQWKARSAQ
jgi:tetratricopeptide (TPR) repeat protein